MIQKRPTPPTKTTNRIKIFIDIIVFDIKKPAFELFCSKLDISYVWTEEAVNNEIIHPLQLQWSSKFWITAKNVWGKQFMYVFIAGILVLVIGLYWSLFEFFLSSKTSSIRISLFVTA